MPIQTPLTRRLGLGHPIIQAPLAGGGDTPALVAAVGNAGAIGFIGASYLTPAQIAAAAEAVRGLTKRPFGINLFAPQPLPPLPADTRAIRRRSAGSSAARRSICSFRIRTTMSPSYRDCARPFPVACSCRAERRPRSARTNTI